MFCEFCLVFVLLYSSKTKLICEQITDIFKQTHISNSMMLALHERF